MATDLSQGRCASSREPSPLSAFSRLLHHGVCGGKRTGGERFSGAGGGGRTGCGDATPGVDRPQRPAREDSAALVTELKTLGVRTVMVTGDAPATAAIVAHASVWMERCARRPDPDEVQPGNSPSLPAFFPRTNTNCEGVPESRSHCRHVRRWRQRRAALRQAKWESRCPPRRCRQVRRRVCSPIRGWPALSPPSRKAHHLPANPNLHAELRDQKNRTGPVAGRRPRPDWTRHPHPLLMIIVMMAGDFLACR